VRRQERRVEGGADEKANQELAVDVHARPPPSVGESREFMSTSTGLIHVKAERCSEGNFAFQDWQLG
jgi:hypothetical protein